jgi:hypothetical protein
MSVSKVISRVALLRVLFIPFLKNGSLISGKRDSATRQAERRRILAKPAHTTDRRNERKVSSQGPML